MVEWGELSFEVVRLDIGGQEVLARKQPNGRTRGFRHIGIPPPPLALQPALPGS